jgi:hypothetical protein
MFACIYELYTWKPVDLDNPEAFSDGLKIGRYVYKDASIT